MKEQLILDALQIQWETIMYIANTVKYLLLAFIITNFVNIILFVVIFEKFRKLKKQSDDTTI